METEWISNDRVIKKINAVIENCVEKLQAQIVSIVLYGSKARGDRNSQNDYEIMVLVENEIQLKDFIMLTNTIRLELLREKLVNAKVLVYTPDTFEDILYNEKITGTFLYMICKENIIIYDNHNEFKFIIERISRNSIKNEEEFLADCIEFTKSFGSEKWAQKWEKTLMQYKYLQKRRTHLDNYH